MVRLSVTIMAHVSRRHLWEPLRASLRTQGATGDIDVYEDDGTLGRWGNGRRCLIDYAPTATHHLVIQDDALPAADLIAGIERWVPQLPDGILQLYTGKLAAWRRIHDAVAQPPCWLSVTDIQWGPALVFPTAHIPALIERADRLDKIVNYDLRLSEANLTNSRLPVYTPSPSWVQHAAGPSTVAGRKSNRHALSCLTHADSVLDWGVLGDVPILTAPRFERKAAGQHYHGRL